MVPDTATRCGMDETEAETVRALLDPVLRALETLALVARHFNPADFSDLMTSVGTPDQELKTVRASRAEWPQALSEFKGALEEAADLALSAFAGLRRTLEGGGDMRDVYRALRQLPRALEALYPLAGILPPVNRFFLDPSLRSDNALQQLY